MFGSSVAIGRAVRQKPGEGHAPFLGHTTLPQGILAHSLSHTHTHHLPVLRVNVRCVLQLVFDMLVLQKHNTEMTVAAGEALYTLVCLHQVR